MIKNITKRANLYIGMVFEKTALSTFINYNVDVGYIFLNKKFNIFELF